jgi:hypothetical protein
VRRALLVLTITISFVPLGARAHHNEIGHGHITLAGPWVTQRSITVLTDADGIDGFFLPAPEPGTSLSTRTVNHSGLPYVLELNFHGAARANPPLPARRWIATCTGIVLDASLAPILEADVEGCVVPAGASTVEVTGYYGADLDVSVRIDHA